MASNSSSLPPGSAESYEMISQVEGSAGDEQEAELAAAEAEVPEAEASFQEDATRIENFSPEQPSSSSPWSHQAIFARLREAIVGGLDEIEQTLMRLDKVEDQELNSIRDAFEREESRRQHNVHKKEQIAIAMQQIFGQWQQVCLHGSPAASEASSLAASFEGAHLQSVSEEA